MASSSSWPPTLDDAQKDELVVLATTYALSHGLLYLPPHEPGQPPRVPSSAIHAPFALFPSQIPRRLFEGAQRIQHLYNVLYARVAMDDAFLDRVMGAEQGVGAVDDFTGQLWRGWKAIRDEGIVQPLHLGLFRSDYLLHGSDKSTMTLKQVEFNTISSSFGALSEQVSNLHNYLNAATGYFIPHPPNADDFPRNSAPFGLVEGMRAAHEAYGVSDARILFLVQDDERNVFDQRPLEYSLLQHGIHVIRGSLQTLRGKASLDENRRLLVDNFEISLVYLRDAYAPTSLPTPQHWETRMLLERSRAIKCPSIPLQLAGGKKVQEALTQPGVLEAFLTGPERGRVYSRDDLADLRATWVTMWGLDAPNGLERARGADIVLKPQREGGGNNVYAPQTDAFMDSLPELERQAWIAMERIRPPPAHNTFVRATGGGAIHADVVSELGIYGWALFGEESVKGEDAAGWLLRTKAQESDEGGVATGFSVLDSVLLVD